jgi:proton-dependent oligopeptide transporter, POT family
MNQTAAHKGHPPALFILFFTEMWERFSYYGMRALLVLFLTTSLLGGGWHWDRADALQLYGLYTGLVYLTPIIGGFIADKFLGYRKAVILGALIMTIGHACMAIETHFFFYAGLTCLILGNGLFKPNISSIVGQLYTNNEAKKDAAYTIFYMGINAGAFLGILLCGYIGEKIGWSYGFGLAGVFMFLGMLQFSFAQKILGTIGLSPKKEQELAAIDAHANPVTEEIVAEEKLPKKVIRDRLIVISVFAFFTIFFWMAFEQAGGSMTIFAKDYTNRILTGGAASAFKIVNTLLTIVPMIILTIVLLNLFKTTFKRFTLSSIFLGSAFVIIWGLAIWMLQREFKMQAYEVTYVNNNETTADMPETITSNQILQAGSTHAGLVINKNLYLLKDESAKDKDDENLQEFVVGKPMANQTQVPASWFGILNSFFIISLAPLFSKLWESKFNPSGPVKFGIGLILLGLGFAILAYGSLSIPQGAKTASVSIIWLILAYLFHTLGELCVSPVGLSYVSKLSPVKIVGLMFGIWFVANFVANLLAGLTGSLIDGITEKYSLATFFMIFTLLPIVAGLVMWGLNKTLKKKMHGIH